MIVLAHGRETRTAPPPAPPSAKVACVVVNHHSADLTRRCLESLRATAPTVAAFVVDNSDPAEAGLLRGAADATVLTVENRGFGAACNAGIEAALAADPGLTHVLLLNPDTVLEPGCLQAMLATFASRPDAGVVGARVLAMDGATVLFERGRVRPCTLTRSHVPASAGAGDIATDFVTGACMLLDAGMLRGGLRFDEGYFLYVEDMDLCRAIAARGRTLWVARAARVRHAEGATQREPALFGRMRARQLRWLTAGKVRFARKWLAPWQRACFFAVALFVKPLAGLLAWRSPRFLRPYFAGLFAGCRMERPPCAPSASSPACSRSRSLRPRSAR